MQIIINESQIQYGLEDGWLGMFTHPCPECAGLVRDWGTTGDLQGTVWATWKCNSCLSPETGRQGRCFDELLGSSDYEVLSLRYQLQKAALAATRGHEGLFPQPLTSTASRNG